MGVPLDAPRSLQGGGGEEEDEEQEEKRDTKGGGWEEVEVHFWLKHDVPSNGVLTIPERSAARG